MTPIVVVPRPSAGATDTSTDAEIVVPVEAGNPNPKPEPDPGGFLAVLTNTLVDFDSGVLGVATASIPLGAGLFLLVGFIRRSRETLLEGRDS